MKEADILLSGGRIWRGLREGFAEAVAVRAGRVLACGPRAAVEECAGPGTRRIDLGGRLAVPGLTDSHMHQLQLGLVMGQVNLRAEEVRTLDELLRRVAAGAAAAAPGAWVLGRGYDHGELDVRRHPTADELSAAAPNNPVLITRACGHVAVANHAAIAAAGVTAETPAPEGGEVGREGGRLTGLFADTAMALIRHAIPKPDEAALVAAVERAGRHMASLGFTAVMDAEVGGNAGLAELDAYQQARATDRLGVRTWLCLGGNTRGGIAEAAFARGVRPGQGDEMLRYGAVKVFVDGSVGAHTARFTAPYLGGGHGLLGYSDGALQDLLARYHRQGWQLAVHAIGDGGIEQALTAILAADSPDAPIAPRRHRIEHCEYATPAQAVRMAARGVTPVPQGIFLYEFGDFYVGAIGPERPRGANPLRTWIDAGLHVSAGSDCPVSSADPMRNIWTQATRTTHLGTVLGPEEAISIPEALDAYTFGGAWTQFAEGWRGRLLPGFAADIAVFSRDFLAGGVEALPGTRADLVLRGGEASFDRDGLLG